METPICQKTGFGKIYLDPTSTGHLEPKILLFGIFQQGSDVEPCWKILKNQSHLVKFGCEYGVKLGHTF